MSMWTQPIHNRQSLKNLIGIMYSKEDILFKALQVNESRASRWCQKVREPMLKQARRLSSDETRDLTQLENIWYEGDNGSADHYNWTRYYALNLHSVFYRGTVEWRCFNSTLHAGKVAAYVNLCLAISAQAIAQRSTVMRKTRSDNELFTFRVWLVRWGSMARNSSIPVTTCWQIWTVTVHGVSIRTAIQSTKRRKNPEKWRGEAFEDSN